MYPAQGCAAEYQGGCPGFNTVHLCGVLEHCGPGGRFPLQSKPASLIGLFIGYAARRYGIGFRRFGGVPDSDLPGVCGLLAWASGGAVAIENKC